MNNAFQAVIGGVSLALADMQGYAEKLIMLFKRFASDASTWTRASDRLALIAIGTLGAASVLLLVSLISSRVRARRRSRALEQELAKQMSRADTAESANQAKAKLLASMSRQIRTQLNSVVGFTDLALKTDLQPELREYMDTVRMSAHWLTNVADNVLDFSQIQAGKLQLHNQPFSISDCIASVMKIVGQDASSKRLTTTCRVDPRLPEIVCGDPTRLRHVIFNLVDNAVRFTTTGGVIVSATVQTESVDDILVGIAVVDTGMGIPPDKHSLIFEPFSHCDADPSDEYHGSGMGLAISRRLVDLMGGSMQFQSHLGAGSRFEFTARFRKYARLDEDIRKPADAGENLHEFSILVAEDNTINRRLITKMLESGGCRVRMATNGKEAVEEAQRDSFDLILMDMEMPALDGLEATRAIRAAEPKGLHVPIYALTAHSFAIDRDRCFEAGMDGFFTKPVAADEIFQLISKLRAGLKPGLQPELKPGREADLDSHSEKPLTDGREPVAMQSVNTNIDAIEVMSDGFDQEMGDAFEGESEAALQVFLSHSADLAPDAPLHTETPELAGLRSGLFDLSEALNRSDLESDKPNEKAEMPEEPLPVAVEESVSVAVTEPASVALAEPVSFAVANSRDDYSAQEAARVDVSDDVESPKPGVQTNLDAADTSVRQTRVETPASGTVRFEFRPAYYPEPTGSNGSPFEQARHALYRSRFDVRIIHNNGDPSDRDLI